jgi:tRNA(Ile)-lysidine synthase
MKPSKIDKTYLCLVFNRFTQFIEKHSLCGPGLDILLAVSGGLDSMVMLDLFRKAGFPISVAHVNFRLRGAESDRDEAFIADYCSKHGIKLHATAVDTNNYAIAHKLSVQMAAREIRYDWFRQLVREGKGDVVATAHHLDDSIETILLNLLRGSGNEGLTGIPLVNGKVIRPMLFATRLELEEYAASENLAWREDESNQSTDYQRNLVRHRLAPAMHEMNPGLGKTFRRIMTRASGDEELIQFALSAWQTNYLTVAGDQIRIEKAGLDRFKNPEALLLRLLEPYGFNFATAVDIAGSLHHQSGKMFHSPTHQVVVDRTQLIVTVMRPASKPVNIESGERTSSFGPFVLAIREQRHSEIVPDPAVAYLDKDKVSFPLQWRTWSEGDYFVPLGMSGRKKVSDFLVDLKLSVPDKQSVTVIESKNEIVCLPGFRIDERFKATPKTRTALVLELIPGTPTKMPPEVEAV